MTSVSRFSDLDARIDFKSRGAPRNNDTVEPDANNEQHATSTDLKPASSSLIPAPTPQTDPLRINFTPIDYKRSFPPSSSPSEITKYSLDKSYLLRTLISREYGGRSDNLLGEMELAFLVFLLGQVYDGLEQWKVLVMILCSCEEEMMRGKGLTIFVEFAGELSLVEFVRSRILPILIIYNISGIITHQLAECPRDFFDSDLTAENFLRSCLGRFVRTVRDNQAETSPVLVDAVEGLVAFVRDTFKWDLGESGEEELGRGDRGEYLPVVVGAGGVEEDDEDDEYAPVVVELEDDGDEGSDDEMKLQEVEEEDDGFVEGYM